MTKHFLHQPLCLIYLSLLGLLAGCRPAPTAETPADEIAAIEQHLLPAVQFEGEEVRTYSLDERMEHYHVPGVSIAVIKDGKLHWSKAYGLANTESGQAVDANTVFQAGSISKPVAALAALKLVDQGKVDLDEDVNTYLQDWKVPDNEFTASEKVTLRRLLTHTAGMTVHGFPGYTAEDTIPSTVAVLDGEGNTAPIRVDTLPGAIWRYSGGGYTVMQKLVEDVSGQDFAAFLQAEVLTPLGMEHSTYEQPLPVRFHANASAAFDDSGAMAEGLWNNYPEKAAAGLWTTPSDLALYCLDVQRTMAGQEGKVLSQEMVAAMLTKDQNDWGLGPALAYTGDSLTFGHGGKNRGFSNILTAFVHRGEGAIIMTNADQGTSLMNEIRAGIADHYGWGWYKPKRVKKSRLSEEDSAAFTGTFHLAGPNITVEITGTADALDLFFPDDGSTKQIYPIGEMTFIDPADGSELVFKKNEAGVIDEFLIYGQYVFKRVEPDGQ